VSNRGRGRRIASKARKTSIEDGGERKEVRFFRKGALFNGNRGSERKDLSRRKEVVR
jgi:hypothetical protein